MFIRIRESENMIVGEVYGYDSRFRDGDKVLRLSTRSEQAIYEQDLREVSYAWLYCLWLR